MTSDGEELKIEERIVVFFDICSSSTILEDLLGTDNMRTYRNLQIAIKNFLQENTAEGEFVIYKFIGDGWILLFPPNAVGRDVIRFLTRLSEHYARLFRERLGPILQHSPGITGLTFGDR